MLKKQYNRPEDSWLIGVEAALRRAGLKAKQEAEIISFLNDLVFSSLKKT